ncbi:Inducible metalloproteinase inhibitor protein [Eumeta japonica]|uniref:Inducible metalloproteinase inhibitor protein n=1 Tax=Eumeta variegata TaxID=151549 RepID=A0A4C1WQM4_EUMVA|nr:Inducible metalloproteinase inhibitor protein [Eumeta japonica]
MFLVPKCPKNEVYSTCIQAECRALNCNQLGEPLACADVDQKHCKRMHLRAGLSEGCGGDPNAKTGCTNYCRHSCLDYNKTDVICTDICTLNGCSCKDNYVYDSTSKKCVLPKNCPPKCSENEYYSTCIQAECRALNCSQLGMPIACPRVDPSYCKKGCVCAEGYVRDKKGKCIPQDTCPEGCGGDPNAKTGCNNYCGNSCLDYNDPDVVCTDICTLNGCSCKDKYVYDSNLKKCVLPEECDKIKCNQQHEIVRCMYDCPYKVTCRDRNLAFKCHWTEDMKCKDKCVCEDDYYRNEIGECITNEQCDKCSGPNEYYSCGGACDNVCATLDTQNQTNCPIVNIKCNEMCYCTEGTARNADNVCVPFAEC